MRNEVQDGNSEEVIMLATGEGIRGEQWVIFIYSPVKHENHSSN